MRCLVLALAVLCAGCAPKLPPRPSVDPVAARYQAAVDWEPVGAETVEALAHYLRIDTTNPGGSETDGARYLAQLLERDGITSEILEFAPGRGSLIARLSAGEGATDKPLCLLSHIDTVPANAEAWPEESGPLSGHVDADGVLWGRGALDMKGMGMLELQVLSLLARMDAPLRRDVVLLAVSDEEMADRGMKQVIAERWDTLDCGHVLNEGGYGVKDVIYDGQTIHAISTGEKGVVWVDMVAEGEPGHGSTPRGDTAVDRLLAAIDAVAAIEPELRWHDQIMQTLAQAGAHGGGFSGFVLRRPALVKSLARGSLLDNPVIRASMTDTIHLTGLEGREGYNVIPSRVVAAYDIRIQPGTTEEMVLERLREATEGIPGISFEVDTSFPGAENPWLDDPVFAAIVAHAEEGRPHAVATPLMSVGYTDSIFAREVGSRAYGYTPFEIDDTLLKTFHGDGERVPVTEVHSGVRRLFGIVVQSAVKLDAPVPTVDAAALVKPVPAPAAPAPVDEPVAPEDGGEPEAGAGPE